MKSLAGKTAVCMGLMIFGVIGCKSSSHVSVHSYDYSDGSAPPPVVREQPASEYRMVSPGEMVPPGEMVVDPHRR